MRLLVLTQIMDRTDPTLGFFVPWVQGLAEHIQQVEVVCLQAGEYVVPDNVRVWSLGKEKIKLPRLLARLVYTYRFYKYLYTLRGSYDTVLVHMNHEYVLLGGALWRFTHKKVYLWRNHYAGSWLVDCAALMCSKIFCTSLYSYTAKYSKTIIMPVGVNVESLNMDVPVVRNPSAILTLGRVTASKQPEFLLKTYALLKERGVIFHATFVGGSQPEGYIAELEKLRDSLGLAEHVTFVGAVANTETFRYYREASVFVNASGNGMLDKTMFKAMAAGALLLSSSKDLAREMPSQFIFTERDNEDLAAKVTHLLALTPAERSVYVHKFKEVVERNSLPVLLDALVQEMF